MRRSLGNAITGLEKISQMQRGLLLLAQEKRQEWLKKIKIFVVLLIPMP